MTLETVVLVQKMSSENQKGFSGLLAIDIFGKVTVIAKPEPQNDETQRVPRMLVFFAIIQRTHNFKEAQLLNDILKQIV